MLGVGVGSEAKALGTLKESGETSPGLGRKKHQERARHISEGRCCGHSEETGLQTRHLGWQRCPQSTWAWSQAVPGPQGTAKDYPGEGVSGNQESNGSALVCLARSFLDPGVFLGGGTVPVMTKKGFSVPLLTGGLGSK